MATLLFGHAGRAIGRRHEIEDRAVRRPLGRRTYKARNLAERFWGRVKQYRWAATRYEKEAANFLAFAKVAAILVMLR